MSALKKLIKITVLRQCWDLNALSRIISASFFPHELGMKVWLKICWFRVAVYTDRLMQLFCVFAYSNCCSRSACKSMETIRPRAPRCMYVSMLKYIFAVSINIFLYNFTISTLHGSFNTAASSQKCFSIICVFTKCTHIVLSLGEWGEIYVPSTRFCILKLRQRHPHTNISISLSDFVFTRFFSNDCKTSIFI